VAETIIVTEAITVERTLAAGASINAASDVPAEGPWNAMLTLSLYNIASPEAKLGGTGVEIECFTTTAGTYRITVTPERLPFAGKLVIG
jgi:hypothetical protein